MNKFKVNQIYLCLNKSRREKKEKKGEFYFTATFYDNDSDSIERVYIEEKDYKDLVILKNYRVVGEVSFYNDKKRLYIESITLV